MTGEFTIGQLSSSAGVSRDAIRYYERMKLLPPAVCSQSGYRLYSEVDLERLRFIKQAQSLGLALSEIKRLLTAEGGAVECRRMRDLLRAKLDELDERIGAMRKFRGTLADHLAACERELKKKGDAAECPVLIEITQIRRAPKAASPGVPDDLHP